MGGPLNEKSHIGFCIYRWMRQWVASGCQVVCQNSLWPKHWFSRPITCACFAGKAPFQLQPRENGSNSPEAPWNTSRQVMFRGAWHEVDHLASRLGGFFPLLVKNGLVQKKHHWVHRIWSKWEKTKNKEGRRVITLALVDLWQCERISQIQSWYRKRPCFRERSRPPFVWLCPLDPRPLLWAEKTGCLYVVLYVCTMCSVCERDREKERDVLYGLAL